MNLSALKSFAPEVRKQLIEAVGRKLDYVLTADTADLRAKQSQRDSLREQAETDRPGLIEKVAYTWFNRLAALRFLDAEGRHPFQARVITAATADETQPEVLRLMRMGSLPAELGDYTDLARLNDLLDGRLPTATAAADPQGEVYRHLILAACRFYHAAMPFVFEAIDDETELLLPDDLLTPTSVAEPFRSKISDEDCHDVEIIGWLYQFYISEKKDEVFAGLKKNKKITPENIPAATQLFTPNWIVRYLVENSLGRLWMLNRPNSRLTEKMDYYIKPDQEETNFLKINSPEEIKICDPACGSGHMLVYAFDLLYAIYEEEGYEPSGIPEKILTNNLFGIDLDERARTLAAFALAMKARARSRRFFRKPIQPNICVLKNVTFEEGELKEYMAFVGRDLFTESLLKTLHQFEEADNYGSLIRPEEIELAKLSSILDSVNISNKPLLRETHAKIQKALVQTDYLNSKYHVVVTNPPYMGSGGMNGALKNWASKHFPSSKADLYSMFIERNLELVKQSGFVGMVTMQSWMFLASFEKLRLNLLENHSISGFVQIGYNSFPELNSKVALASAFILVKNSENLIGSYLNLNDAPQSADKEKIFFEKKLANSVYTRTSNDFKSLPGNPLAYWLSKSFLNCFTKNSKVGDHARAAKGLVTANNEEFVRDWFEVSLAKVAFSCSTREKSKETNKKWFPYAKGGEFRRWSGNFESFVNWENDGYRIRNDLTGDGSRVRATNFNLDRIFIKGISWTVVTTSKPSFREVPNGFLFDAAAGVLQSKEGIELTLLGLLNSKVSEAALAAINPTLNLHPGYLESLPYPQLKQNKEVQKIVSQALIISKRDWDSYEKSWDFISLPLLHPDYHHPTLKATYQNLRAHWRDMTLEVQRVEKENNRIFIGAYNLNDELDEEVDIKEITLTCNPNYRYSGKKTESELDALLQEDTVKEFISYAVGCMFGRYSLDKPGLILANQGETLEGYVQRVEKDVNEISFLPDDDAIIPVLNGEWFEDDAVARVREFLRVTFGNETLETNLRWLEESIGKNLRAYFCANTGGFYDHHLKTYKKRPIYWMFQSPKKHFRALVYLHRYTKDTVNQVLDGYLREFMHKLRSRMEHLDHVLASDSTPTREATQARREKDQIIASIRDCEEYEREILLPLAQKRIELDLDDGVKVNYNKLGNALAKVTGLSE